ncbi:MAG TPA: hypothetical protein V6D14_08665 [Coleofasciculaceae cyanobacterium]
MHSLRLQQDAPLSVDKPKPPLYVSGRRFMYSSFPKSDRYKNLYSVGYCRSNLHP